MLKDNPNVKSITTSLRLREKFKVDEDDNWEPITIVQTDLYLDCIHEKHDATALNKVLADANEYLGGQKILGSVQINGLSD